jgi:hypothetical protein
MVRTHLFKGEVAGREQRSLFGLEKSLGEEAAFVAKQFGEATQPVAGLVAFLLIKNLLSSD